MSEPDAEWFFSTQPRPSAEVVVYGFPHAGGGCASLNLLAAELPETVELRSLNLPGRQARFDEENRVDLDGVVADIATAIAADDVTVPTMLFGYCTGALLAWLTAEQLATRGPLGPRHLIVTSYPAPDRFRPVGDVHDLPSEEFWDRLVQMGGVPAVVADNEEFRPLLEPSLRADFELFAGHLPGPRDPLPLAITGVEGTGDQIAPAGITQGWERVTTAGYERVSMAAGHWVLEDDPAGLAAVLAGIAGRYR